MATSTHQENAYARKVMADGVRSLNADGRYGNLSPEAKYLYSLALDRVGLSTRNGWRDETGYPFICFSASEAALILGVGESKARRLFRELESLGLIRREKRGQGRPDRLFVRTFDGEAAEPYN